MNNYKIGIYILGFIFILSGCTKDNSAPTFTFEGPDSTETLYIGDRLEFIINSMDNEELQSAIVKLSFDDAPPLKSTTIDLMGTESTNSFNFDLDFATDGDVNIDIEIRDASDNFITDRKTYAYKAEKTGQLLVNMKLKYNNEPLIMFQDYQYPDGRLIDFTRFSFYISELSLDDQELNSIEFHNLTNNNAVAETAITGYDWIIDNVPTGMYSNLNFNIGVPEPENSMDPGEFPSGHPLAKPAENWFSWNSYIFFKVEGNIDLDNNGSKETAIAMHLGSSDALRSFSLDRDINVLPDGTANTEITFDIYDFFGGSTNTYMIDDNPQIHSLGQMDAVMILSDLLTQTIK